jgi:hypothetical protein
MNQISLKRVALVAVVVLVLSRTGRILEFLKGLDLGGMLTIEPLRSASEGVRCLITIALCALVFVVLSSLFQRRK